MVINSIILSVRRSPTELSSILRFGLADEKLDLLAQKVQQLKERLAKVQQQKQQELMRAEQEQRRHRTAQEHTKNELAQVGRWEIDAYLSIVFVWCILFIRLVFARHVIQ